MGFGGVMDLGDIGDWDCSLSSMYGLFVYTH